ncbi:hypothetical protein IFM89_017901 [Coptis chinensis]|uniref:Uncharacterized protein n=1 Tax=Coptis chinensis TaxID=261450 RepID=A0A835I4X8_9MAGN|nr:hypothetical protein IFM89_017901 [Coptis chinensis]
MTLTLWEGMTSAVPDDLMEQKNVVIVATSLKANNYQGRINLSSFSATKIYIDMDINNVNDFKQCFETTKVVVGLGDSIQSGSHLEQEQFYLKFSVVARSANNILAAFSSNSATKLTIALWGALTDEFPVNLLTQENVIVIATSLDARDFQGNTYQMKDFISGDV